MKKVIKSLGRISNYLFLAGALCLAGCNRSMDKPMENAPIKNIKVANWNIQAFGIKKVDDPILLSEYRSVLTNYDIIFIQEVRDNSDTAFRKLCEKLTDYDHKISSRAGRTLSKEQYGVVYKKNIQVINFIDFNPDTCDRWERPPIEVDFKINDYTLRVYNVHTKPQKVSEEIRNLEQITTNTGNKVIIGDLNASGNYYNRNKEKQFLDWNWIIKDNDDTTVAKSQNAYDRILMNKDAAKEFVSYGINTNVSRSTSDHYPVYVEISPKER